MNLRIIGAVVIVMVCGGLGFDLAARDKHETATLSEFIKSLAYLQRELDAKGYALAQLCRNAAQVSRGIVSRFWSSLSIALDARLSASVSECIEEVMTAYRSMPQSSANAFRELGNCLGKYDREVQLQGILAVLSDAKVTLQSYRDNQPGRIRCYQTLGLCAGAAIAILVM